MAKTFKQMLQGYTKFQEKYSHGDSSIMKQLAQGQKPEVMVVTCCDSRVDPALILQCDPGDLFVVRNVANIIPPYEKNLGHHGASAALEYGIKVLQVKQLIILGHSQCGGIQVLLNDDAKESDFIQNWISLIDKEYCDNVGVDDLAKCALQQSYKHSMQFPWIAQKIKAEKLQIQLWFFDIETGKILEYDKLEKLYKLLSV